MNVTLMGLLWAVATSDDGCTNCVDDKDLPQFERILPHEANQVNNRYFLSKAFSIFTWEGGGEGIN